MINAPRVVAVDDNVEHLEKLVNGFGSLGGYCVGIEYSKVLERPQPFNAGVRFIFMDINLLPGAGDNQGPRTFDPIVIALQSILRRDNGPYALVTWTNTPDSHESLISYLANSDELELLPCANCCLAKDIYLEDPRRLALDLKKLNREVPGFGLLVNWETAVLTAAGRSVTAVYELSGIHGIEADPEIAKIAFNIGAAAVGGGLAKTQPIHSLSQGMSSVLSDRLDHKAPDAESERDWVQILSCNQSKLTDCVQKSKLNRLFNVAETSPDSASTLGMVYRVKVRDILPFLKPKFKTGKAAILSKEFLPRKCGQNNANEIAKACKLRFIRLGAPCDFANAKDRVVEGHLAIEVPENCFDRTLTLLRDKNKVFKDVPYNCGWLFQTPPFFWNSVQQVLVINLRYRISFPLSKLSQLFPVYRLKDKLSAEIATQSANFSTRPGISEFR